MWHLDWEIDDWFKKVKSDRRQKYGISSSNDDSYLDPDSDGYDENVLFDQIKHGDSLFDD